jgi:hypothetical protein
MATEKTYERENAVFKKDDQVEMLAFISNADKQPNAGDKQFIFVDSKVNELINKAGGFSAFHQFIESHKDSLTRPTIKHLLELMRDEYEKGGLEDVSNQSAIDPVLKNFDQYKVTYDKNVIHMQPIQIGPGNEEEELNDDESYNGPSRR